MGTKSSRPTEPIELIPPAPIPPASFTLSTVSSTDSSVTSDDSVVFPLLTTPPPATTTTTTPATTTTTTSATTTTTTPATTTTTTPATTPTTPHRSRPLTKTDCIRNLIAESRGCNQLDILIESHGEPTLIADPDHSDVDSLMEEINTTSKREFNAYKHAYKLKTVVHEVLLWDNRVAFSIKDPDTDDIVIFRIYNR